RGVDQVLLGRLAGNPARSRVENVLMDRVGDETSSLIRIFGALHRGESTPPAPVRTSGLINRVAGDVAGLPHRIEAVAVDRGDGDDVHLLVAFDGELDQVAGAPRPELLVEFLLRGDGHAVDP